MEINDYAKLVQYSNIYVELKIFLAKDYFDSENAFKLVEKYKKLIEELEVPFVKDVKI